MRPPPEGEGRVPLSVSRGFAAADCGVRSTRSSVSGATRRACQKQKPTRTAMTKVAILWRHHAARFVRSKIFIALRLGL